ncbi:MAG: YafY family protein [Chloroflexia bacterium]
MRADRLISILMFLQARGRMTAAELAEELEVSERTIYRDLEALHTSGVPVLAERGPGGGVTLPDNYRSNLTGLSDGEVRALFLSAVPGPLADLGLGKSIEAAIRKLTASLPDMHRRNIEQMRERMYIDTAEWFRAPEQVPYLDLMQRAVWDDRLVDITYSRADSGKVKRCLEPYGLVAKGGVWYVVAAVAASARPLGVSKMKAARRTLQTYRVSRIQHAELMDAHFERPEWFNLHDYWERWQREFQVGVPKYLATVRVSPDLVYVLPRIYGEDVRALIDGAGPPDGEGWIRLTLTFRSFEDARTSLLGLGANAEVVEPMELHAAILDMAGSVVELYGGRQVVDGGRYVIRDT